MKQIAQYQDGRIELQDVPKPVAPPGGVLVRVTHSVISIGTEKMKVEQAKMNLLQKAKARPDQVRKVLDTARNLGWKSALEKVRNRLESPTPMGYSAAGIVEEVDPGNGRFRVGDMVACGGAECAFHAEYIGVPDMLTARVPEGVEGWQAAYTTICSIALHAARQAEPRLGDKILVFGQGLVGLLITSMLQNSGARVMAVDVVASRRPYSQAMGAERVVILGDQDLGAEVKDWTDGFGVDSVILCTSGANAPVEAAANALRDRGRLVEVGITEVQLPWRLFNEKELDVRYSRSYGPGRYDPGYEWGGNDYPIGHVRWTEQRNFQACLHLMASGRLPLAAITTRRVPFLGSVEVYRELPKSGGKEIGIVLEYGGPGSAASPAHQASGRGNRSDTTGTAGAQAGRAARLGTRVQTLDVIGAGNFARTMLLPHLKDRIAFGSVVNQTALSANHVRTKFGFTDASTDAFKLLQAPSSNAVVIATRHSLHAPLVEQALKGGRHIFVEKPICLTREELAAIDAAYAGGKGTVQVGFNRRFAPASAHLKALCNSTPGAKTASYRVFAGPLDPQHWFSNLRESGGRVLGETCHFLDYFRFLFGSEPRTVYAHPTNPVDGKPPGVDSVMVQVDFRDGSSAHLNYTAQGDPSYPKEVLTVYGAGWVAEVTNFLELSLHRGRKHVRHKFTSKGHAEQMAAWSGYLRGETDHPFPYEASRPSMELTFAVLESIQANGPVHLASNSEPAQR